MILFPYTTVTIPKKVGDVEQESKTCSPHPPIAHTPNTDRLQHAKPTENNSKEREVRGQGHTGAAEWVHSDLEVLVKLEG